jgi:hypothetical protein
MPFMVEATSLLLQRTLVVIAATVKSSAAELKSKQLTIVCRQKKRNVGSDQMQAPGKK